MRDYQDTWPAQQDWQAVSAPHSADQLQAVPRLQEYRCNFDRGPRSQQRALRPGCDGARLAGSSGEAHHSRGAQREDEDPIVKPAGILAGCTDV